MKLVLHNYFIIREECFLEQLGIIQNHALNILGCVTARKDDDLEIAGCSLGSPQKCSDIRDRNSLTRPEVASRGRQKSIRHMGEPDSV